MSSNIVRLNQPKTSSVKPNGMHQADIVVFPISKRHDLISRTAEVLVTRQSKRSCDKYWTKVINHERLQMNKLGLDQSVIRSQIVEFKMMVQSKIDLIFSLQGAYKK